MDDIAAGRYNGGFAMAKKVSVHKRSHVFATTHPTATAQRIPPLSTSAGVCDCR